MGFLTRIPDMLVAGIPVIVNQIAARSTSGYSGVYSYQYPEELNLWLDKELPMPSLPEKPEYAEKAFIHSVLKYSSHTKAL